MKLHNVLGILGSGLTLSLPVNAADNNPGLHRTQSDPISIRGGIRRSSPPPLGSPAIFHSILIDLHGHSSPFNQQHDEHSFRVQNEGTIIHRHRSTLDQLLQFIPRENKLLSLKVSQLNRICCTALEIIQFDESDDPNPDLEPDMTESLNKVIDRKILEVITAVQALLKLYNDNLVMKFQLQRIREQLATLREGRLLDLPGFQQAENVSDDDWEHVDPIDDSTPFFT